MKIKILEDVKIANPIVCNPHYQFNKDEEIDIDNEYLLSALLDNKHAECVKREYKKKEDKKEKMNESHDNKMLDTHLNKSIA